MTIRATSGFGVLRYDPGNPEFPTLPDGVIVPHFVTIGSGGGSLRARKPISGKVYSSAPANDRQRFAGWQTDTTWVNPTIVDFGIIPSPVRRTVSLYNARTTPVEVTALTLPSGVTLISPALPQTLEAYDGITFTLEATTTGDNEFDEDHIFTTDAGDATFRLIGRRIFTLKTIPQTPIIETLQFRTDILRSTSGTEKVYSLLQSPNTIVDYEVFFTDDLQRIRFKNQFIAGASELTVAGQKWYEARRNTVAISSTDTVIYVSTENTSFVVGGTVSIVSEDGLTTASGQITSLDSSPENTSITLGTQIGENFAANSFVLPVALGYVSRFPTYSAYAKNLEVANYSLTFNQEEDQGALDPMFPTLSNVVGSPVVATPILDFCNEITGRLKRSQIQRHEDSLESGLSNRIAFSTFPFGDDVSDFQITLNSPEEVWKWRQFIHYLRGSYNDFYVPTFLNDIPGVTTDATNIFNADDTDLALLFGTTPPDRRNALRIIYPDGQVFYRIITAVVDNVATEQITVDSALIAGNPIISYLQRSRILGDTVTFRHNREDDVVLTFKYRTLTV